MRGQRSRRRAKSSVVSRRNVLAAAGTAMIGGGALASFHTQSASVIDAGRSSGVVFAEDPDAFVGLDRSLRVKKNDREPLVYVENTLDVSQPITITITNCADDILYNPADQQATCQITGTVDAGETGRFDIEAQKARTVEYTIDADSVDVSLNANRTVDVVSGNVKSAVTVKQFSGLTADTTDEEFTIDSVHVKDGDGDDDLDRAEFVIQDNAANTVATATKYCSWTNSGGDTVNCKNGAAYNPSGQPDLTIQPDDAGYDVTNQTYQATVTGYDVDGNFDTDTVTTNE